MESIKFNKQIPLILNNELLERLDDKVQQKKQFYNSRSHFVRCAIIEKLNKGEE